MKIGRKKSKIPDSRHHHVVLLDTAHSSLSPITNFFASILVWVILFLFFITISFFILVADVFNSIYLNIIFTSLPLITMIFVAKLLFDLRDNVYKVSTPARVFFYENRCPSCQKRLKIGKGEVCQCSKCGLWAFNQGICCYVASSKYDLYDYMSMFPDCFLKQSEPLK